MKNMKSIHPHSIILLAVTLLVSCQKDIEVPVISFLPANERCTPSYTSAVIEMTVPNRQAALQYKLFYSTSATDSTTYVRMTEMSGNIQGEGIYRAHLAGLTPATLYYYYCEVSSTQLGKMGKTDIMNFETKTPQAPMVRTGRAYVILSTEVACESEVTDDGGTELMEMGICYSISNNRPTVDDWYQIAETTHKGTYDCLLSQLTGRTTYYYRSYARNAQGLSYGDVLSFTTLSEELPNVRTNLVKNITASSAICTGTVSTPNDVQPHTSGVCYSTSPQPEISDNARSCEVRNGKIEVEMVGLKPGTRYYVRAFATNINGTSYGEELEFVTNQY